MQRGLVGSEMCIRDSINAEYMGKIVKYKIAEIPSEDGRSPYAVSEILLKFKGKDIMSYRRNPDLRARDLINILYQSSMALATANSLGIFSFYVNPYHMLYENGSLKWISFDTLFRCDPDEVVNEKEYYLKNRARGIKEEGFPPELWCCESLRKELPIIAKKIDTFSWGLCMLQFLTGKSEKELYDPIRQMQRSKADSSEAFLKICNCKIPLLKNETSSILMRLLCQCLSCSPSDRLNMEEVRDKLAKIIEEFKEVEKSPTPEVKTFSQIPAPRTMELLSSKKCTINHVHQLSEQLKAPKSISTKRSSVSITCLIFSAISAFVLGISLGYMMDNSCTMKSKYDSIQQKNESLGIFIILKYRLSKFPNKCQISNFQFQTY
eukprot:TRINITY_DN6123_c0_g3_i1.p1 TRINITY_DN6123_c0_g3~~TRINITY_DN6123_c0_g3_i1.p1  ORF type:complete len:379 (-),score=39.59 TRINITY_DN6123_c0_g3_i1:575-1711(-)